MNISLYRYRCRFAPVLGHGGEEGGEGGAAAAGEDDRVDEVRRLTHHKRPYRVRCETQGGQPVIYQVLSKCVATSASSYDACFTD